MNASTFTHVQQALVIKQGEEVVAAGAPQAAQMAGQGEAGGPTPLGFVPADGFFVAARRGAAALLYLRLQSAAWEPPENAAR
ncbi:MAG: hypothetical protein V2I43_22700 [Parvularcula sp.]|nr:hypothetical protein [Parvularcula sp.]